MTDSAITNDFEIDLKALIRPVPPSKYECEHGFRYIESALETFKKDYDLDLHPDFQRGHVWSQQQQEHFIENVLRGAVTSASLLIQFNAPDFERALTGDLPRTMLCIDGLQRLTAVRRFVNHEIRAFGLTSRDLDGTAFDTGRYRLKIAIHTFQSRVDILQYYLDINAGGTQHSPTEIERIRVLHDEAKKRPTGVSIGLKN